MATTALFAEFLVIGASAWLWILPVMVLLGSLGSWPAILGWLPVLGPGEGIVLVVATYGIGIVTDSFASLVEGWTTYSTEKGQRRLRAWFLKLVEQPPTAAWAAAQARIWDSELAHREFLYDRLRLKIGRGLAANAAIGAVLWWSYAEEAAMHSVMPFTCAIVSFGGAVTWLVASREYYHRVAAALPSTGPVTAKSTE